MTYFSLGAMEHDPKFSVKVFFFADYSSMGCPKWYPGGCGVLTLEQFEKSKMAANMAVGS